MMLVMKMKAAQMKRVLICLVQAQMNVRLIKMTV